MVLKNVLKIFIFWSELPGKLREISAELLFSWTPNILSPIYQTFHLPLRTFVLQFFNKNLRKCRNSLRFARIKKFVKMRSSYFSILRGPCFINLFHPSQFKRDTAIPPIFVKELDYKCLVNGRQNVRSLGEQKFGGNLPQPTRKLRSRKKIVAGHSWEPIEPIEISFFSTMGAL